MPFLIRRELRIILKLFLNFSDFGPPHSIYHGHHDVLLRNNMLMTLNYVKSNLFTYVFFYNLSYYFYSYHT